MARPLNLPEWAGSLALYAGAVALCAWVTVFAASGAGIRLALPVTHAIWGPR